MIKKTNTLGIVAILILGVTLLTESIHALTTTAPNGIMMPEDITFIPDPEHTQIACDLNYVIITWNHSWSAIRDHAIR